MENELILRVQGLDTSNPRALSYNKEEIDEKVGEFEKRFKGRIYTKETAKDSKKDRAEINAFKNQVHGWRVALKKAVQKIIAQIDGELASYEERLEKLSLEVDKQEKAFEEQEKAEKRENLKKVYLANIGALSELITFEKLLVPQWLNKTFAFSTAEKALKQSIKNAEANINHLKEYCDDEEEYTACLRIFTEHLDFNEAMAERSRRKDFAERQRKAEEAKRQEQAARLASPFIQPPTNEEIEMTEQAERNFAGMRLMDENGRLDMDALRPATQPKTWTKTLRVTYTAEQGKKMVVALKEIGVRFEIMED